MQAKGESWQLNSIAQNKVLDTSSHVLTRLPLAIPNLMPVASEEVSSVTKPVRRNLCQIFMQGTKSDVYFRHIIHFSTLVNQS